MKKLLLILSFLLAPFLSFADDTQHVEWVNFDASTLQRLANMDTVISQSSNPQYVIVEFSDYTCPYCKARADLFKTLAQQNHAKFAAVVFPALGVARSGPAVIGALAARNQDKKNCHANYFAKMHQALMHYQGRFTPMSVRAIAQNAGLNMQAYDRDVRGPALKNEGVANANFVVSVIQPQMYPMLLVFNPNIPASGNVQAFEWYGPIDQADEQAQFTAALSQLKSK